MMLLWLLKINSFNDHSRLLTDRPRSPFSPLGPLGPASIGYSVGGTSQLKKPSVAGGVTMLNEVLVGRGLTPGLVTLLCFVVLVFCLENGFEVLAVVVLEAGDFVGLTLDDAGVGVTSLIEFVLGLEVLGLGVLGLEVVGLGLGDVFFPAVGEGFLVTGA